MREIAEIRQRYINDPRELPLIVAEAWGFELQHYIEDTGNLYAAQDWVAGLIGKQKTARAMDNLRRSQTAFLTRTLPYFASDGKTYQRDFTDARGLYTIAAHLRSTADRPALAEIKRYLAAAGVLVDEQRRDPDKALEAGVEGHELRGRDPAWIQARVGGIIDRRMFTDALADHVIDIAGRYGTATNKVYKGLWGRDADTLKRQMGLSPKASLRDHQPRLALHYQGIVEGAVAHKLGDADKLYWRQAAEIIEAVAGMIGIQAEQLGRFMGVDLGTGRSLLGGDK